VAFSPERWCEFIPGVSIRKEVLSKSPSGDRNCHHQAHCHVRYTNSDFEDHFRKSAGVMLDQWCTSHTTQGHPQQSTDQNAVLQRTNSTHTHTTLVAEAAFSPERWCDFIPGISIRKEVLSKSPSGDRNCHHQANPAIHTKTLQPSNSNHHNPTTTSTCVTQQAGPRVLCTLCLTSISPSSRACGSAGPSVMMEQAAVKWLSRPQGEPSGVCTGHRKPQLSGSSLRTVVVRSSAK